MRLNVMLIGGNLSYWYFAYHQAEPLNSQGKRIMHTAMSRIPNGQMGRDDFA